MLQKDFNYMTIGCKELITAKSMDIIDALVV